MYQTPDQSTMLWYNRYLVLHNKILQRNYIFPTYLVCDSIYSQVGSFSFGGEGGSSSKDGKSP